MDIYRYITTVPNYYSMSKFAICSLYRDRKLRAEPNFHLYSEWKYPFYTQVPLISFTFIWLNIALNISFHFSRLQYIASIQDYYVNQGLIPVLFKLLNKQSTAIFTEILALIHCLLFNANPRVQVIHMTGLTGLYHKMPCTTGIMNTTNLLALIFQRVSRKLSSDYYIFYFNHFYGS